MLLILIIFVGNIDVDSFSFVSDAIRVLTWSNAAIRLLHWVILLPTNQFDLVSRIDPSWKTRLCDSLGNKRLNTSKSEASRVIEVVGHRLQLR